VAAIAAFFSLLGTSWSASKEPSEIKLKWLEDEVIEGDILPHMEITFADGTTDEIFLEPDPENECFHHGSLKGDIESEVEVDGCKNDAEIVQISSRLVPSGLVILLLENGKTFTINPFEGIGFPNGTDGAPPVAVASEFNRASINRASINGASWQGALPTTAFAKIHVGYDQSLVDLLGSKAEARKKVKAIVDLSRMYFRRDRGLSMNIEIEIQSTQYYNARIGHPTSSALNGLNRRGGGGGYPTAWFTAVDPRNGGIIYGIGHIPGLCNGQAGLITEVFKETWNDASSALLFAHELGHNLGMQHDFHETHRGSNPNLNRDSQGHYGPCNDKGIMSYYPPQNLAKQWSDCSRKDQENTFRTETHSCMARRGGGGEKYEVVGAREDCGGGKELTTESECRKAARELGMDFEYSGSRPDFQRYCLSYGRKVWFNKDTGLAPSKGAPFQAICSQSAKNPARFQSRTRRTRWTGTRTSWTRWTR